MPPRAPGVALILAGWLLAAASLATAWRSLSGAPAVPEAALERETDDAATRALLARLRAENEALRRELDRQLLRGRSEQEPVPAATPAEAQARPAGEPTFDAEIARRAREAVLLAKGGGERAWGEALEALTVLVNEGGTNVFPAMRDIYEAAEDERARRTILPMMLFSGGGDEGLAFVASEIMTLSDAALRGKMLVAVARTVSPGASGLFKGAFLDALGDENPKNRARAAYGLRYVNDPDVTQALFRAAADSEEIVRRIAFEQLVARSADPREIRRLIAGDPSPEVRQIARCHLRIAAGH